MLLEFVKRAIEVFESWGYPVRILRHPTKDYLSSFHHIILNPTKHPEHAGRGYGFPLNSACLIRRDLKIRVAESYLSSLEKGSYVQFLGICADEPKRLKSMAKEPDKRSILAEQGYTQDMARQLCADYGLLSPSYGLSKRGGCWCCPWAQEDELRFIKRTMPELWEEFLALEEIAAEMGYVSCKWNVFRPSLKEMDRLL